MLVYYVEGDHGHLMDEELGGQQFRTLLRGSCCSFHMPWEHVLRNMQKD